MPLMEGDMKVRCCELYPVSIPIERTSHLGSGQLLQIDNVLIRVVTEDGVIGWGESSPWSTFGETQSDVVGALQHLLIPVVVGERVCDIERILTKMDAVLAGHSFAKAGLEIALFDALARTLEQPLFNLLGGCFRESIPVGHSIMNADADLDL
jgi:L-alanine-DL-glutamate epimerase-like enolase superfamily enzyme